MKKTRSKKSGDTVPLRHTLGNQGLVFYNSSSCPNYNNGGCTGVLDAYSMLESYP
jgi:hypothetical protein